MRCDAPSDLAYYITYLCHEFSQCDEETKKKNQWVNCLVFTHVIEACVVFSRKTSICVQRYLGWSMCVFVKHIIFLLPGYMGLFDWCIISKMLLIVPEILWQMIKLQ